MTRNKWLIVLLAVVAPFAAIAAAFALTLAPAPRVAAHAAPAAPAPRPTAPRVAAPALQGLKDDLGFEGANALGQAWLICFGARCG